MRTLNTFGIQFLIRVDKLKDGKAPIYARITANGDVVHFSLKQWIDPVAWDQRRGHGKGKAEQTKVINHQLEQIRVALGNHFQRLQLKDQIVSANAVKDAFLGNDKLEPNSLSRLVKYHNEQARHELKASTMKHYLVTQRYLSRFLQAKFQKKDIMLREINYKFFSDFETFLRAWKPVDHQKPMNNNGVMKHIIRFKKMINLAVKLEWIDKDPSKNFKVRIIKVDKQYLSERELQAIENKKLLVQRLEIVRDIFVFCCYTGLAYIDVMTLGHENIITGIDDENWIKTCRQKTSTSVMTPILPKAQKLIEKYKDHNRIVGDRKVFPVFSNQKVNSYLKEIASLCGITKNLTSHVARHTFATTITLSNGVPIETVSKILGHTKISTTQIYARVLERKISDDMQALKTRLAKK